MKRDERKIAVFVKLHYLIIFSLKLVETLPTGIVYKGHTPLKTTYEALVELLEKAEQTIDMTAFFWDLTPNKKHSTDDLGRELFKKIKETSQKNQKRVKVKNKLF